MAITNVTLGPESAHPITSVTNPSGEHMSARARLSPGTAAQGGPGDASMTNS